MIHPATAAALEKAIRLIGEGKLGCDGYLPPLRRLADELEIGRGAAPSLLRELAARGLIDRACGRHIRLVAAPPEPRRMRKILVPFNGFNPPGDKSQLKDAFVREYAEIHQVLTGILAAGEELGLEILPRLYPPNISAGNFLARCRAGGFDAVICLEHFPAELPRLMAEAKLPLVVANLERAAAVAAAGMDFRQVGRFAGRTLVEAGHRRIGFLAGSLESMIHQEVFAGFKGALAEDDLEVRPDHFARLETGWGPGHWERQVKAILLSRRRPTALFVCRDRRAAAVFAAADAIGLRIPEDLSVLGYDNLTWPDGKIHGLTTIEQPAANIGRAAVYLLDEYFKTGVIPAPVRLPPGPLIRRTSLSAPPSRVTAGLSG
ncbi:MAG: substrate-binding domain-containing protein [Victivallaceae bacterium]